MFRKFMSRGSVMMLALAAVLMVSDVVQAAPRRGGGIRAGWGGRGRGYYNRGWGRYGYGWGTYGYGWGGYYGYPYPIGSTWDGRTAVTDTRGWQSNVQTVQGSGSRAYYAPTPSTSNINVYVPRDAQVWVQGKVTTSTGTARRYVTPSLTDSADSSYEIRARWTKPDGQVVDLTQEVPVVPGQSASVNFNALAAAAQSK